MLSRNEMRQAKKLVEVLISNNAAIKATVEGVIEDIDKAVWPDHEMVIPVFGRAGTVGAIRQLPDWKTDPLVINHLIAAVQGRMLHFQLIQMAHIDPSNASPDQIAELLTATDPQQRKVLEMMCGKEVAEKHWKEEQEAGAELADRIINRGSVSF